MRRPSVILAILLTAAAAGLLVFSGRRESAVPVIASENLSNPLPQNKSVEVRYIANEGVLISSKDKRVLIDGLHRRYGPEYAFLPDTEREKIETAKPPFEKIDLLLVSHMHGDHFHAESVGRYLASSPTTVLASSQQVVDLVASNFTDYEKVKARITPVAYKLRDRRTVSLGGVEVEFLGVSHGTGRHSSIENLAHVFKLGGKTFLHVGDAEITPEIFDSFDLETRGIDIAILPYWFLTSVGGRAIIREHIKPKHLIAVHIGPGESESVKKQIDKEFPDADVFGTMLEKRNF